MNNRDVRVKSRIRQVYDNSTSNNKINLNKPINKINNNSDDNNKKITELKNDKHLRKEDIDYNAIIILPSYNRYNKLIKILEQLYTQKTKYTFLPIVINDGSNDIKYDQIPNKFNNIKYIKNERNYGLKHYWKTFNKLLNEVKQCNADCIIQIDDDFILCDNFIDRLNDLFFSIKENDNNYIAIKYHLGVLGERKKINDNWFDKTKRFQDVDGGTL
ncbi:MAG: glycosyltransferase family 2 protein, partial [bacterium]